VVSKTQIGFKGSRFIERGDGVLKPLLLKLRQVAIKGSTAEVY
jgi:hypothetical protein